jgi:hypothetical protein
MIELSCELARDASAHKSARPSLSRAPLRP